MSPKRFKLALYLWMVYVAGLVMNFPLHREAIEGYACNLGFRDLVAEHGKELSIAAVSVAALTPVIFVLWLQGFFGRLLLLMTPNGRAQLFVQRGSQLFQRRQYEAAIAHFSTAIELNPLLAVAYIHRGSALIQLERHTDAFSDLDEAIRLDSTSAVALAWRGQLWAKRGNIDKALADLNSSLEIQPSQANVLAQRGYLWAQLQNDDRALNDFEAAISAGDRSGELQLARGNILTHRREYDRAINEFNEALVYGGVKPKFYSNRGMAFLGKGDLDHAIADFSKAIGLDSQEALYFNNRGYAYLESGKYAEALADLNEAMRLRPSLPYCYKNLAWLMATCPDAKYRNGTQAIRYARKALELVEEKIVEWFATLAAAHAEAGDFTEATRLATKCLNKMDEEHRLQLESHLECYQSGRAFRCEQPKRRAIN